MQSREAVDRLRRNRTALAARGIRSLAIFGSTARNEARPDSDVDVLVEIEAGRRLSLLDLSDIKFFIGDVLGAHVDLALGDRLRPAYRSAIEKDLIPVF
jgi:uncharacterized protein